MDPMEKKTQFWKDVERAQEDVYFAQRDRELLEKLRQKKAEEDEALIREIAHMRCPKCGKRLKTVIYKKVEVDVCDGCAGVWLDAGELEKLTPDESSGWASSFFKSLVSKEGKPS